MKKDIKIYLILGVIVILIIVGIFWIKNNNGTISEETAKCIGKNSVLYVKVGCPACEIQEKMFGENYKYLNTIDCHYQLQECIDAQITGTPTWIINRKKYPSVQSLEKLKELTGC